MIILTANGITMEYGTDVVLNNISFSINSGDRLGVIGVNGAGKSTLLKIIAGTHTQSSGDVFVSKGTTIGMLEQNAMLESDKTIYDEMLVAFSDVVRVEEKLNELSYTIEHYDGDKSSDEYNCIISEFTDLTEKFKSIGGYEYKSRIRSMLTKFGFDEPSQSKSISLLSGGERTRLALVRLLLVAPDILMLDEPTNHLDTDTLEWLENHLKQYPKTLIVVSHDRLFLDNVTNKILDIEHTEAKLYPGNYSAFAIQKAEALKTLSRKYEQQQKEIERIEGIIAMQRHFGQERNFITIASKKKQIEHMEKIDAPKKGPKNIHMSFQSAGDTGNEVLNVERLSKRYNERVIFDNINFLVKKKDRIIIVGPNGCGKSTLIKIIGGIIDEYSGVYEYGSNVVIGYYDQEQKPLNEDNTVLEELCEAHDKLTFTEIRSALASFLFFTEDLEKKVGSLSGGEKARLMLCKMILSKVNVLILDEPTNHLDIGSREALENALLEFDGTIIAVSHDRYFVKKLATRLFDMSNGFLDYKGNYEEFSLYKESLKEKEAIKIAETTRASPSQNKSNYFENKKLNSDIRKAKSKLERIETKIEELENKKDELNTEACGDASTNYVRLSEIGKEIEEIDAQIEDLFMEYEETDTLLKSLTED
ncbi:MAG: ABC-F family ATP-binding cassette domain-containing protein [Clostridia bacterium]|nr:ABC-F family ATP-binding cassette domain-containing protein [Clostridia bacterium]